MAPRKTVSLTDLLEEESGKTPGGKCTFGLALRKASEEDRALLIDALGKYTGTAIAGALKRKGILQANGRPVQAGAITRHRRGQCLCPDSLRGIDLDGEI